MKEQAKEHSEEIISQLTNWLNDEAFIEEQFKKEFPLFKEELNKLQLCINGELPGAKFEVGEYVHDCKYTKGEKTDTRIVRICSRSFAESRGWVYAIDYIGIDKEKQEVTCGGSSAWWDEKDFQKIDDPLLLLIIQKNKLDNEQRKKQSELAQIQNKQEKLHYAFQILRGIEV